MPALFLFSALMISLTSCRAPCVTITLLFSFQRPLCRSVSTELVKALKELKCMCGKIFSNTNLPVIAYCGHYVCASHEKEVLDNDTLFKCKLCSKVTNPYPNSFLHDLALEDFYTAIKEKGYLCQECGKCHPRENSVYSQKNTLQGKKPFLCVWCAVKDNNFKKYDVRSIGDEAMEEVEVNMDLCSIDRTRPSGWSLFECGICNNSMLLDHDNKHWTKSIVHLRCNHIIHKGCSGDMKRNIICTLCDSETAKLDLQERKSHALGYFRNLSPDVYFYFDCMIHGKCLQKHPASNTLPFAEVKVCVWCHLEYLEDARLEKVKQKKGSTAKQNKGSTACTLA
ncbi:hypothetical protein PRIPAC_77417 [Pristionchus pacificus]|uniref:C2H2-type domain-containing protein n=1 Tax=Pristionchus pacificus TaxID=54126 RepID=A0A2A6CBX2_PRIPA|nr:hypothetical protein PRIPAC_77417 [Pristionchus pacificus]|eukprot:PDM75578.1 hypothetical protein PRIPAC_42755 [Pristionchus pacificus]